MCERGVFCGVLRGAAVLRTSGGLWGGAGVREWAVCSDGGGVSESRGLWGGERLSGGAVRGGAAGGGLRAVYF